MSSNIALTNREEIIHTAKSLTPQELARGAHVVVGKQTGIFTMTRSHFLQALSVRGPSIPPNQLFDFPLSADGSSSVLKFTPSTPTHSELILVCHERRKRHKKRRRQPKKIASLFKSRVVSAVDDSDYGASPAFQYCVENYLMRQHQADKHYSTRPPYGKNACEDESLWDKWRGIVYKVSCGRKHCMLQYSFIAPGTTLRQTKSWKGEWLDLRGSRVAVKSGISASAGPPSFRLLFDNALERLANISQQKKFTGHFDGEPSIYSPSLHHSRLPTFLGILAKFSAWHAEAEDLSSSYHCATSNYENTKVDNVTLLLESLNRVPGDDKNPNDKDGVMTDAIGEPPIDSPGATDRSILQNFLTLHKISRSSAITETNSSRSTGETVGSLPETVPKPGTPSIGYCLGALDGEHLGDDQSIHSKYSGDYTYAAWQRQLAQEAQESCDLYYMSSNDDSSYNEWKKPRSYATILQPISVVKSSPPSSWLLDLEAAQNSPVRSDTSPLYSKPENQDVLEEPSGRYLQRMFKALLLKKKQQT